MCVILSGHQMHVIEHVNRQANAHGLEALRAFRPDPGCAEPAGDLALSGQARPFEAEDLLHRDDVLLHPGDLGDGRHLSRAVRHT